MAQSKIIGIISYFPDEPELRENRRTRCFKLLNTLNEHFKLPIILVAQNWTDEELSKLNDFKNQKIYAFVYNKLGITGARIKLRKIFLDRTDADYIILLDDDSDLIIKEGGVEHYLKEIDDHPNMFCKWNMGFPRLMAISRYSYNKLSYDFIAGLEPERGEVWEDHCWHQVYKQLWPNEVYEFSRYNMQEVSLYSEHDPNSVYYKKWVNDSNEEKFRRNREMWVRCAYIIEAWKKHILDGGK